MNNQKVGKLFLIRWEAYFLYFLQEPAGWLWEAHRQYITIIVSYWSCFTAAIIQWLIAWDIKSDTWVWWLVVLSSTNSSNTFLKGIQHDDLCNIFWERILWFSYRLAVQRCPSDWKMWVVSTLLQTTWTLFLTWKIAWLRSEWEFQFILGCWSSSASKLCVVQWCYPWASCCFVLGVCWET